MSGAISVRVGRGPVEAERFHEGMEGPVGFDLVARPPQEFEAMLASVTKDLGEQPGLADPGLP